MEEDEELKLLKEKMLQELMKNLQKPKTKEINKPIKITIENFKDIISSNNLVLIDFWADWCQPCKIMEPIINELSKEFNNVVFGKVNVDEEPAIAQSFGIMSIPTFILFKNGKPQEILVGARPKRDFENLIKRYIRE
jgi:thioredoxin